MKACYIMVGVSGSGKSTVVNQLKKHNPGAAVFSLDDCRLDMYAGRPGQVDANTRDDYAKAFAFASENTAVFNQFVTAEWQASLKNDVVIVDNTNLTTKSRARWSAEARQKGFHITVVNIMVPLSVVLSRQLSRTDKNVPATVVRDMYMRQQEVSADEADSIINVDGTKPVDRI